MEKKIIYYDKLFPIYDNNREVLNKLKIDKDSVSYISSPIYAEKITKIILNHTKTNKINITDCTAGCGGDTISFLNKFKKVYSIEKNLVRFNNLFNNIKVYNLTRNSRIYCGGFFDIIKTIEDHDIIYIDPPWGGKNYRKHRALKLNIDNIPLEEIIIDIFDETKMKKIPNYVVLKLPSNYDLKNLYNKINTKSKIYLYNLNKMLILVLELNKENKDYLTSSSLVNPSSDSSPNSSIPEFSEGL